MSMFRKKPVVIEARQFDGTAPRAEALYHWMLQKGFEDAKRPDGAFLVVPTMEGSMIVSPGDWLIRGVHGEFYPCKPEIFAASYDKVEGE